jgi:hypothetical protein
MREGEKDPYRSKRGHPRYVWHRTVELLVDSAVVYGRSRDICEAGIGLVCKKRLQEHQRVYIRCDENDPWVPTRVAQVTQSIGEFKAGMELTFEV